MTVESLLLEREIYYTHSGRDLLIRCLNPEHEDHSPSLRVNEDTGIMHCFSCGFKGNIFKHFKVENSLILGGRVQQLKAKIRKINSKAIEMPEGFQPFTHGGYRKISLGTYKHFGAFIHEVDFPDRIVFPLYDFGGNLQALISRELWTKAAKDKYRIFPSGKAPPIFPAIPDDLSKKSVIVVEGVFDVLNLYDKGLRNVVALLGKGGKAEKDRLSHLNMLGIEELVICLDPGDAEIVSANKLKAQLKSSFNIRIFDLREISSSDPGDLKTAEVKKLKDTLYEKSSNSTKMPKE